MSILDWHAGMKVVCVDAADTNNCGEVELTLGRIYTLRWVGSRSDWFGDYIGVRLVEVVRKPALFIDEMHFAHHGEMPFRASRFRPLVKRAADISVFTAMLDGQRQQVPV
jgi:hypothetical protein